MQRARRAQPAIAADDIVAHYGHAARAGAGQGFHVKWSAEPYALATRLLAHETQEPRAQMEM